MIDRVLVIGQLGLKGLNASVFLHGLKWFLEIKFGHEVRRSEGRKEGRKEEHSQFPN